MTEIRSDNLKDNEIEEIKEIAGILKPLKKETKKMIIGGLRLFGALSEEENKPA